MTHVRVGRGAEGLHRVAPRATWTDEIVRDERKYERPRSAEWVSGACLMVRRSALEELVADVARGWAG